MKRWLGWIIFISLGVNNAQAAVKGQDVDYSDGNVTLKGYLAFDDASNQPRPGVIVVHEWWGHDAYARKRAEQLASEGYTALALDMYGEGKQAHHPQDAGKMSGEVRGNFPVAMSRFKAAMNFLKMQPEVDVKHIAAIGYCFGGGIVLEMARRGTDLDAVVSFHGSLAPIEPAKPGAVKAKVMVHNGEADSFVKAEQIEALAQEMKAAGANYQFFNYPGAIHSFTNPGATELGKKFNIPLAYQEEADKLSWSRTMEFFKKAFASN